MGTANYDGSTIIQSRKAVKMVSFILTKHIKIDIMMPVFEIKST